MPRNGELKCRQETERPRGPNYWNLVPIVYAPILPLIRIGLRGRVSQPVIDRIFLGSVGVALSHAGYIMLKSDCEPEVGAIGHQTLPRAVGIDNNARFDWNRFFVRPPNETAGIDAQK